MTTRSVGSRVSRQEDPALLTGQGRFVDDLDVPGVLHVAFTRAPLAHATVASVDAGEARAVPGVRAVYTAAEPPGPLGERLPQHVPSPAISAPRTQAPLVRDEVCFVGEPVAMVVAASRYVAEDAADLVEVDYEELPAVADLGAAQAGDGPAHHDVPGNEAARFAVGFGDVDAAFARAAHVVHETFDVHRGTAHPMEGRAVLAVPDPVLGTLTVWSATQAPHLVKDSLVQVLGLPADSIRVIAPPDVGGGFGPKLIVYPEEIMVAAAARALGVPVKWTEDRREHFMTTTHERDQRWEAELALDGDGKLLGLRGSMRHDTGAYLPWGVVAPYISATTVPGPYVLPAYALDVTVLFTNTTPTTPVRGAGRPQAVFVMERLLDRAAAGLGLDRADIRLRNLVPPEAMPYAVGLTFRDGSPVVYDTGDYPATLRAALDRAGYAGFAARREAARSGDRRLGIGVACYVEGTGLGPFEGATVRVQPDGAVVVYTGAAPQGQGHRTTLAQVCADALGLDPGDVTVVTGDTGAVAHGIGTFASRVAVNAGNSVHEAATAVREQVLALAGELLEVGVDDLELAGGQVRVRGDEAAARTFGELARASGGVPGFTRTSGGEPGLDATSYYQPTGATYAHGAHVAEVAVDAGTGHVSVVRYVVAHDCGTVINPTVVDGQIQGGVAHGIGNALLEWMGYDGNAQPVTTTFADYLLPLATDVPAVEIVHLESPTPLNPLGVKGAGEGGTIPAAAAIVAAVEDALGLPLRAHPVTPAMLLEALRAARPD